MTAQPEPHTGRILFVDDEESMRAMVEITLEKDGHAVDTAADGAEGLARFEAGAYDLVIEDLKMPKMDGIELLRRIKEIDSRVPVIVVTAFSTWDTAVEAMRLGAYDYLKKPFDNDEVRALVQRALASRAHPPRETPPAPSTTLTEEVRLVGATEAVQNVLALVRRVAATDSTLVITGESGTGKELIARMAHMQSHRRGGPFISVNCGAFTETLLESEIFGHVKGSFTGAVADKQGLLEIADGGTFFLDEVGEMTLQTQIRFLRVLEEREFLPVGGTEPRRVSARFIAATNRDLGAMVDKGTFREDLFYRLNVIPVHLPPLRERREDIPLLAGHFIATYAQAFGREIEGLTDAAMQELMGHSWPGNVRELQNTIQRAVTLARGTRIEIDEIQSVRRPGASGEDDDGPAALDLPPAGMDLEAEMAAIEARYIEQALERTGGNLTQAADLLGITFRSIRYKVKKLGIGKK